MGRKRATRHQVYRGISPKNEYELTPSDKGGEYSKYYMREYRKVRGYLAGRSREDYNAYMRKKMREYRKH